MNQDIYEATPNQQPLGRRRRIGNPLDIINSGDSLDFSFDRGDQSVAGWACRLVVRQRTDTPIEIDRVIPLDEENRWSGFLTSAETAALTRRGIYRMIGVLTNSTTGEQDERVVRFQLNDAWS